jgi:hypothetical protein
MIIENPVAFLRRVMDYDPELFNKTRVARFFGLSQLVFVEGKLNINADLVFEKFSDPLYAFYILTGYTLQKEKEAAVTEATEPLKKRIIELEAQRYELEERILKRIKHPPLLNM